MLQKNDFTENYIEPCNEQCSFCFLNYADILGKNYLFRNLDHRTIGQIIRDIHHQVKKFGKGDLVASAGDSYNNLYIIVNGAVVAEIIDFEGRVLRIEELRAPDTIATAFIFGDDNALPVDVMAVEETKILSIAREDLLQLFRKHETVLHNYLNIMANRAQHLSNKIKLLGMQSIRGKVAHYLLNQMKKAGSETFSIPHTQSELSVLFGVSRPSVGRVMAELNQEGILNVKAKSIHIRDKKQLSSFLK